MKELLVRAGICAGLCVTMAGSQIKKDTFEVFYIPLSLTNCWLNYTENSIEYWHNLTSLLKNNEASIVKILDNADLPCEFKDYDVRLKVVTNSNKYLVDQTGCVKSKEGEKLLGGGYMYNLKFLIDDRIPSNRNHTSSTKVGQTLVLDEYETSGAVIQGVHAAWSNLILDPNYRDLKLSQCVVRVQDAGNSLKTEFVLPPPPNHYTMWHSAHTVIYWVDKESGRILKREIVKSTENE